MSNLTSSASVGEAISPLKFSAAFRDIDGHMVSCFGNLGLYIRRVC